MHVRTADCQDAFGIAEIHVKSWQTAYRGIISDEILDRLEIDRRATQWFSQLEAGVIRILIAEQSGRIRGFAAYGGTRDPEDDVKKVAEIQAVYIDPDMWGRGIGRLLCESIFTALRDSNYEQMSLWVLKDNLRAIGFYESMGFVRDGGTRIECLGEPLQSDRYRRELFRPV